MPTCTFSGCYKEAIPELAKCVAHKHRRHCQALNCNNMVYARNLCVRHGGRKQCQSPHCTAYARGGDFCVDHGGVIIKRLCSVKGCHKQAHARQLCVRHGGGRLCRATGCTQHARDGALCHKHKPAPPAVTLPLKPEGQSHVEPPHMNEGSKASDDSDNERLRLTLDILWALHPNWMNLPYAGTSIESLYEDPASGQNPPAVLLPFEVGNGWEEEISSIAGLAASAVPIL
ncbi:unnamed protein product [Aphanomyces euteiches]|nr:hypothetical protein AeRB84_012024 [Aphanomyces euteiches]